jgi:protein Mpv17
VSTEAVRFLISNHLQNELIGFGKVIFGPAATGWFRFLEKYVSFNKSPNLQVVARVACDQILFAPVAITAFFSAMTVMEGGNVKKKLQSTWWDAVRANWHLWPVVQLLNFRLVPLPMRIVVVNVVSIGKATYGIVMN